MELIKKMGTFDYWLDKIFDNLILSVAGYLVMGPALIYSGSIYIPAYPE
jgi:hypothetical protein